MADAVQMLRVKQDALPERLGFSLLSRLPTRASSLRRQLLHKALYILPGHNTDLEPRFNAIATLPVVDFEFTVPLWVREIPGTKWENDPQ